ncbi:MAG: glutamine--fructose-6-phosphate transaminase (isomerizing) [Elusimicrobia bacterium HGW-Elusimicrobia-1]|jgi:glucosamine--fructose-6-phosphate aminotransferase (isomerizing)|nr:MAG: glutamine--fructose-6-phosphate transaminase (isomerizing) [Elusimicrobia bacterium HGW-Elusimicrobia-1]
MCGIVGYAGTKNAASVVLDGLKRLEYRGYDSAGIASIDGGKIKAVRGAGKIAGLEKTLKKNKLDGFVGIGHTRWATHGKPSEENAHPHASCKGDIVVVHNGIIENYIELKNKLAAEGHIFRSETDTEVVAHLVEKHFASGGGLLDAVRKTIGEITGAYALAVIAAGQPDSFVVARKDAPLIVGFGDGENFAASDIPAVLPYTKRVAFLEDGDIARVSASGIEFFNGSAKVEREVVVVNWDSLQAEKGGYKHFMLKEIFEQPQAVQDTFRGRLYPEEGLAILDEELGMVSSIAPTLERVHIVACGTSYHAGLVGKYLFEKFLALPCEVDIASEFRYRNPVLGKNTLVIAITQSGETADTLAGLRLAKSSGVPTLAITNVIGSTASREAAASLFTRCGPEIGVASTKAFTGQLTALYMLLLDWAVKRKALPREEIKRMSLELWDAPVRMAAALKDSASIEKLAKKFFHAKDFLYLGRNVNYPIALEGALKLKEISYIHAEGYAAGEMKHGPIALIDENMPVMVVATDSAIRDKILSNIEEVRARSGTVIALVSDNDDSFDGKTTHLIKVPTVPEFISPLINVVPLQLFAYYCSVLRGNDVDQPRNLAKSVTVE